MSVANYIQVQQRLLARLGIDAESCFVDVPAVQGRAHVLVAGDGPAVVMVPGAGTPSAMWAPLMAELPGFTLYVVDLPGMGLTSRVPYASEGLRSFAVEFLDQVVERLGLDRPVFVAASMGALWTTWLALDRPARVPAIVYLGCPATMLGTSAPFPSGWAPSLPSGDCSGDSTRRRSSRSIGSSRWRARTSPTYPSCASCSWPTGSCLTWDRRSPS